MGLIRSTGCNLLNPGKKQGFILAVLPIINITGGLLVTQTATPITKISDSIGLGKGHRLACLTSA